LTNLGREEERGKERKRGGERERERERGKGREGKRPATHPTHLFRRRFWVQWPWTQNPGSGGPSKT